MAHDHNYYNALIAVADDCPVSSSVVPPERAGKPTVATVQYGLLVDKPFVHKQEDVLFLTWFERQDLGEKSAEEVAGLRAEFFAKPKPCLRTSPLAKQYGWGFAFNAEGFLKLCPVESAEYRELLDDDGVKTIKAMKASR
ncbi:DUF6157 family protein [Actinokineospora globicatena]|uniref:Uncharacterized protein n=1 Tax=Actinokineospora globicatena TaxID=103729 RepID=A0A9W6QFQ2_9PSEU|nr:DUF6157 family protein [Actinokineospora globicatena]GLW89603.1 hypothetical protein Aglo03_04190 [Actinokineospora globicatena]